MYNNLDFLGIFLIDPEISQRIYPEVKWIFEKKFEIGDTYGMVNCSYQTIPQFSVICNSKYLACNED